MIGLMVFLFIAVTTAWHANPVLAAGEGFENAQVLHTGARERGGFPESLVDMAAPDLPGFFISSPSCQDVPGIE